MRIIGGTQKGRRINPPANLPVRPTTDLAKESLFNILNNVIDFEGLRVLDLFAGTGSISYEFASREASLVTSVELNFKCVEFIRKTATELKFVNLTTIRADVFKFLSRQPAEGYDLIFSDAPYDLDKIVELPGLIFDNEWLKKDGRLIIEHSRSVDFAGHPQYFENRRYGKVNFSFFINSV